MHYKIETKWVVFTGASSSGKTTTAQAFKELGFEIRDIEIAREYIEEITVTLRKKYPGATNEFINQERNIIIQDPKSTYDILSKKLAYETSLDIDKPVIIDSGLACGIVYPELFNTEMEPQLKNEIDLRLSQYRYKWVFSFDMLDFVDDGVRFEHNQVLRNKLHTKLREKYEELGYHYIPVPVMPLSARIFCINNIMKPAIQMIGKGTKLFSGVNSTDFENPKTIRQNSIPYGSFFKPVFAAANETSSHYLNRYQI